MKRIIIKASKKGNVLNPLKMVIPGIASSQLSQMKKKKKKKKDIVPYATSAGTGLSTPGGQVNEIDSHSRRICEMMLGDKTLTDAGMSSLMTILNPCGELGAEENAKFPDGTLSQSGIQRFRQFETITAPWQTISSSANVTNNWSLYILSPAAFKTIAIFVVVRDARSLSDLDFRNLFNLINISTTLAEYPIWEPLGEEGGDLAPNIYYSIYSFRSASLEIDPATGESRTIESFRVVGDGFVVMHNSPDLWNQGSFACGQFKTDFALVETDTTFAPLVFEFNLSNITPTTFSADITLSYQNFDGGSTVLTHEAFVNAALSTDLAFPIPDGVGGISAFDILTPAPASDLWMSYNGLGTPVPVTVHVTVSGLGTGTVTFASPGSPFNYVINFESGAPGSWTTLAQGRGPQFEHNASAAFNPSQLILSMPALNQDAIAQADPKFSAELMKAHNGFYMVRRYFEPKLNMNNSNVSGPIKLEVAGMDKQEVVNSPGGIKNDILDRNGAFMVAHIKANSYASSPTIKSLRFIEFLPAANSPLGPFVGPPPAKDEDAEEVFRQMQLEGPHSYIPDANFLGTLAGFIMNVVSNIPVYLRGARSISQAVIKAIDWGEEKLSHISA